MAYGVLIAGRSGSGKSSSIRNLPPAETCIINIDMKPLPFKGASKMYIQKKEEDCSIEEKKLGKIGNTKDYTAIINAMVGANGLPRIKYIVLDTLSHMITGKFMGDIKTKGYDKYVNLATDAYNVLQLIPQLREDIIVFVLIHTEYYTDDKGQIVWKAKTFGKLLEEKITIESYFSVVLEAIARENKDQQEEYLFNTNDVSNPTKSPMGMFEDKFIDNDLLYVAQKIKEYEQI